MSRARAVIVAFLGLLALGVERPPNLGDVTGIRHWSYPDYTRVVVDLTRPVRTEVQRLAADRKAKRPERLYLDLPGIWVGRQFEDGFSLEDGLLQGVRVGQNTLSSTRVVLDLERYQRHRIFTLTHPDRVVVDVYGARPASETLRWPSRDGMDERNWDRLPIGMREVRTIVVDAGHGGRDPGATGVGGLREKDVTLRLARRLGAVLEERGFRVVYTRKTDRTLELEERTAIAEGERGDLFVSLHANAASRRSVSGIETYYLDADEQRHDRTVAARENGIPRSQVDDLQRTLAKLRVSEASGHSRDLATTVHRQLLSGVSNRYGGVPDLGVKKGPFYVLFLSQMPAILVEAGFLTNRADAKRLRDGGYLDVLAEELANGLVAYRDRAASIASGHAR